MNPLVELRANGQSVWLDNIRRGMILSGELEKLIKEDGVRGMTSNPAIFEKAVSGGTEYDSSIKELISRKKSPEEIFDDISIEDIQMAADAFRPLFDQSQGEDGYVSIEVSPRYARDSATTVDEARRLWKKVGRPNLMVKIPATREGLPAVEKCLYEGINVNITLIFSIERYREVMGAYRSALEDRARDGRPLNVASVASFFVSRIDTAVDKIIQEKLQASKDPKEKDALLDLLGKIAVANAKVAYQAFKKNFSAPWFEALKKKGASAQRPLWASTGTKNPHYSDILYVQELIGPQTVNTMPPATLAAYKDHGRPRLTVEENALQSQEILDKLKGVKIDLGEVTHRLEEEGVDIFVEAYEKLLKGLAEKKAALEKSLSGAKP